MKKRVISLAVSLMIAFSCIFCGCSGKKDEIAGIDGFIGSISVGICIADCGKFENKMIDEFTRLLSAGNHHVMASRGEDPLTMVSDFVAGGMDFVVCFGYDDGLADEIISVCDEKGTYPVAYEGDFGTYSFSPEKKKDSAKAAGLLLKYLFGIIMLGDGCPAVYSPKC